MKVTAESVKANIQTLNNKGEMLLYNGFCLDTEDVDLLLTMLEKKRTDYDRCACGDIYCTFNGTRGKCSTCINLSMI